MSYFDQFFESSYHELMNDTGYSKEELKQKAKQRIIDTMSDSENLSDREVPGIKVAETVAKNLFFNMEHVDTALFSKDLPLNGTRNCLSYSCALVSALEFLERDDVISSFKVKQVPGHVWLYYNDGKFKIDVSTAGLTDVEKSQDTRPLETLLALNHSNCTNKLYNMKEYDAAIEKMDQAIEIDGGVSGLYLNKAGILMEVRRYNQAIECYDKSLELDPTNQYSVLSKLGVLRTLESLNPFRIPKLDMSHFEYWGESFM